MLGTPMLQGQDPIVLVDSTQVDSVAPGDTLVLKQFGVDQVLGVDMETIIQVALKTAVIVILAWVAVRLLKSFTRRMLAGFDSRPGSTASDAEQRAHTLVQLLNSVGTFLIVVAALLSVLNLFVNIGPLIAGIGVLGLAVSFGAQSLVKDVISGFFILFENQYDVGDIVEINGVAGVVEAMTLRIVTLRDIDGVVHKMPNGSITKVSNKTSGWARVVVDVGVGYGEDIDRVMAVVDGVVREFREDETWSARLPKAPDILGVQEFGDSAVVVRLALQTKPGRQWEVKRELLRRIKNRFDAEGIEIPFPQRTVHIRDPKE